VPATLQLFVLARVAIVAQFRVIALIVAVVTGWIGFSRGSIHVSSWLWLPRGPGHCHRWHARDQPSLGHRNWDVAPVGLHVF
jgi:hypothetical protein